MKYLSELKLLLLGVSIAIWFRVSYRLIDKFVPDTMYYDVLLLIISFVIFYSLEGTIKSIAM